MFKKFLIISIVLFVVVLVSGCGRQENNNESMEDLQIFKDEQKKIEIKNEEKNLKMKETIDLNDGWKSYKNYKIGYEIQYPKEMYIKDCDYIVELSFFPDDINQSCEEGSFSLSPIIINYGSYPAHSSSDNLRDLYINNKKNSFEKLLDDFNFNEFVIGDKNVVNFFGIVKDDLDNPFSKNGVGEEYRQTVFFTDNNPYEFRLRYINIKHDGLAKKYEEIFNQIIDRFKILNK